MGLLKKLAQWGEERQELQEQQKRRQELLALEQELQQLAKIWAEKSRVMEGVEDPFRNKGKGK